MYILIYAIKEDNLGFGNDMIILKPFVGQERIDVFYSQWTQMKNSEDFYKITNQIKVAKNKYNVE